MKPKLYSNSSIKITGYILLLWEVAQKQSRIISHSGDSLNTFPNLLNDFAKISKQTPLYAIRKKAVENHSRHNVNIHYVTKKIDKNIYEINKTFLEILRSIDVKNINLDYTYTFNNQEIYLIFECFKTLFGVNKALYDGERAILRKYWNIFINSHNILSKEDIPEEHSSKIFIESNSSIFQSKLTEFEPIFIKRNFINIEDFFIYTYTNIEYIKSISDVFQKRDFNTIQKKITDKLRTTIFYNYIEEYDKEYNTSYFLELNNELDVFIKEKQEELNNKLM